MQAKDYLGRSRLFQSLKNEPYGRHVEHLATRLVEEKLARHGTWRCLNVISGFLGWLARRRSGLADIDENMVEQYLRDRATKQSVQPGDRAALKRWLLVLRDDGAIRPVAVRPLTPHARIFKEFEDYLRTERGLVPGSIVRHRPIVRQFLQEVCPAGADDFGKINQESVIGYIERHARDWSPATGKTMCRSLRAFLRVARRSG